MEKTLFLNGESRKQSYGRNEIQKDSIFNDNEIKESEGVVEMNKELSTGINGFNEDELIQILSYISST